MPVNARKVAIAGAIIIAVILTVVGVLSVLLALLPPISQPIATSIALNQLHRMNSSVNGFVLVSARYDPVPKKEYDANGNLIYSESGLVCQKLGLQLPAQFCPEHAAWVLHFRAPAQNGFKNWNAYVLVNARTGSVGSASIDGQ